MRRVPEQHTSARASLRLPQRVAVLATYLPLHGLSFHSHLPLEPLNGKKTSRAS